MNSEWLQILQIWSFVFIYNIRYRFVISNQENKNQK